jgi:prepilin-type N-terminal cleavage/methylation domain-containing protein
MSFSKLVSSRTAPLGFTLIELLIVVAIIAILAAIAVPNLLEAQVRSKVARVHSDLRSIATAVESYRIDHDDYPEGSDNPDNMSPALRALFGPLAPGFYAVRSTGAGGEIAGIDFHTLTTPIAYIGDMPPDPFSGKSGGVAPYAYRNAKAARNGWILTSAGPDTDLFAPGGVGNTNVSNPLSTAADSNSPARLADINERAAIHFLEGTGGYSPEQRANLDVFLKELTYDPTNGSVSDGDLWHRSGSPNN